MECENIENCNELFLSEDLIEATDAPQEITKKEEESDKYDEKVYSLFASPKTTNSSTILKPKNTDSNVAKQEEKIDKDIATLDESNDDTLKVPELAETVTINSTTDSSSSTVKQVKLYYFYLS